MNFFIRLEDDREGSYKTVNFPYKDLVSTKESKIRPQNILANKISNKNLCKKPFYTIKAQVEIVGSRCREEKNAITKVVLHLKHKRKKKKQEGPKTT